jgi:hypothetical protein
MSVNKTIPTLKIKQAGRDQKTRTPRYTIILGMFRGTDVTKAEANELRLMKLTLGIPDGAHARKLLCLTKKALFTACEQSLAEKVVA